MTGGRVRIVLVDDHTLFRSGMRMLLGREPGFEVVGEAGDASEGIKTVTRLAPDVVLLDLNMPGMSGAEAARILTEETPDARVLMLTVSEDAEDLFAALRAGACGYLLKNIEADALITAVRSAAAGESVISPCMMGKLLAGVREDAPAPERVRATADAERLTPRESEILGFIARGKSNKEIARALDVAESTVKIHVQNLLRKLGLASRVQAAVYAVGRGIGGD
ncbi:MAG: response regulator transcription factor [Azoarcus sp.]|nr:response regulator transcription factor [Azoarcus sp.]